jgi:hypothetical protein
MIVGAGEAAEIAAIADAIAGHEEAGVGRLRCAGWRGEKAANDRGTARPATDAKRS